ncbi:MAG: Na+/H+ antiporter subunit E [Bauldia sp.]|nr:Na+/H+ antiporter subunit E [Bauldia sp.]MCW5716302.1 Na+/H+ antiporter subunit E [Bauldia sp.]
MTRRLLPYPLLVLLLWGMWLLLQQSVRPGQLLLGLVVAFLAGHAMAALRVPRPKLRRLWKTLELFWLVTVDILHSNVAVATLILFRRHRAETSAFLLMPLKLRDRNGLAVLACILTAAPGTAWLEYNPTTGMVLVHVFDLVDEKQWIERIRHRYERLLLEIFQ